MSEAPKKIYLQTQGDYFGYTWYHRPIGNTGIKYIRADLVDGMREALETVIEQLDGPCDIHPDCPQCKAYFAAQAALEAGKVDG